MNVELRNDCDGIDWGSVHTLLKDAGMATYPPEVLRKAFESSYAVVFLLKDERVIGSGRAISDGAYQAALYDFAVLPEYQGRGFGRQIADAILERVDHCNIMLYAAPSKEGFYERFSFKRMRTGMARFLKQGAMRQKGFIE
jgi:ribosomal protein S18 acetylase RimI-like enzyme